MNIYICVFLFLLCASVFESILIKINNDIGWKMSGFYVAICSLLLVALAGLRPYNVGADTAVYFNDYFNTLNGGSPSRSFEFGYRAIEIIGARVGLNATAFFVLFAFCTFCLLSFFLCQYSPLPAFSLTYYYARFFMARDLNEIRQSLAAMFAIWSIKYMNKKNPGKFLMVVMMGALIHKVTLLMLVPYVVINIFKFENKIFIKYSIALIFSILSSIYLLPNVLNSLMPYLGNKTAYLTYDKYLNSSGFLNPVLIFEVCLSFLLVYILKYKKEFLTEIERNIIMTYMIGSLFLVLFNQYGVIGGRTSSLLTTVECIVVIYVAKYIVPRWARTLFLFCTVILVFYVINIYSQNIIDYLPYTW